MRSAKTVATRIPNATASPCRNREYCVSASRRMPNGMAEIQDAVAQAALRSSAETTSALMRTASAMICSTIAGSWARTLGNSFVQDSKQVSVANHAAFDDFIETRPILPLRQSL